MTNNKMLDCRGLACPQPVLNTREALAGATEPILVIVDNEGSATNVRRFAEGQGARVGIEQRGGDFHLSIEPGEPTPDSVETQIVCESATNGGMVVLVSSEGMGRGDDELGAILMEAFLDTLSQFRNKLSHVIFINAGAKLAVDGSPVLPQIRQLEEIGVQVLVCGTCLNHFGILDRLGVGRVSNMYEIIDTLSGAGRVLRP
jgi:selenium metabolism protein YedF